MAELYDVLVWEANSCYSRETLTVKGGNTFAIGQIGCEDKDGKVVTIENALDDIYRLRHIATADGGQFAVGYRGDATSLLLFRVTPPELQTAMRALHVDFDNCTVTGTQSSNYSITVPHEKKSDVHHLIIANDSVQDGSRFAGTLLDNTAYGEHPSCICTEIVQSGSDVTAEFIVRACAVNITALTGYSADVAERLKECGIVCK